jgi:hypothetical protein
VGIQGLLAVLRWIAALPSIAPVLNRRKTYWEAGMQTRPRILTMCWQNWSHVRRNWLRILLHAHRDLCLLELTVTLERNAGVDLTIYNLYPDFRSRRNSTLRTAFTPQRIHLTHLLCCFTNERTCAVSCACTSQRITRISLRLYKARICKIRAFWGVICKAILQRNWLTLYP